VSNESSHTRFADILKIGRREGGVISYPVHVNCMTPKVDPALHLLGGAGSGMVACTALQPLDLIKTRLQQQRQDHLSFLREAKTKGIFVAPQKR
jgi:hypothetical protein